MNVRLLRLNDWFFGLVVAFAMRGKDRGECAAVFIALILNCVF